VFFDPVSALRRLRSLRPLRLLPVAALVVLASACEVRTRVEVAVEQDGSGTVEVAVGLDRAALARVPDLDGDGTSGVADLAALVRTEDLEAAGWRVVEPREAGSGTTWIRVSKRFGTPAEANAILAEVTGPSGPLRDLRLSRSTGFASTELSFSGTADLSGGLEAFGDSGLAQALDGEPLGEDAAQIEQRLGRPLAEAFHLDVIVDLPGSLDANTDDRSGGAARWSPRLGEEASSLSASGSVRDWPVVLATILAVVFLVAAVLAVVRLLLARSRPEPEPEPAGEPELAREPEPVAAGPVEREPAPEPRPEREPASASWFGQEPGREQEPERESEREPASASWFGPEPAGEQEPAPEPRPEPEREPAGEQASGATAPAEGERASEAGSDAGSDAPSGSGGSSQSSGTEESGATPEPDVPGWHHPPPVTD
jgi:outer membrane biosynthesis protein TonB